MIKLLSLLALVGTAPLVLAEDAAKPAAPDQTAEALATPPEKRTDEQKALVREKIRQDNLARMERERLANLPKLATARAEKVDLAKLLDGNLTDAEGKPVSIETIKKARYIAFYHSASWCCGCKTFTPLLLEAAKKYAPADIAIVLVSWDEPGEETRNYMHKAGMPWPSVTKAPFANSPARLGINGIPHMRVYDASGSLVLDSLDDKAEHIGQTDQINALSKLAATPAAAK